METGAAGTGAGVIAADTTGEIARLLRDDAADAFDAYERLAALRAGEPDAGMRAARALQDEAGTGRPWRALVVAAGGATTRSLEELLGAVGADHRLAPGAPVLVIAASDDVDGSYGRKLLDTVQAHCAARGLVWGGGVIITHARLLPRLARAPRLGAWRRPVSEAIDAVVAAARIGCTLERVDELLERGGAAGDAARVRVASPHPLWVRFARMRRA